MCFLFWFLLFYDLRYISCINQWRWEETYRYDDERIIMGAMMFDLARDVIKQQNDRDAELYNVRHDNIGSAAYEIGYMTQVIQEHYRRMLDKWYSAKRDIRMYYNMEMTLYLEEIEHLFWAIKHEVYMLHEIERKYKITEGVFNETYVDDELGVTKPQPTPPSIDEIIKKREDLKPNKLMKELFGVDSSGDGKDGGGKGGGGKGGTGGSKGAGYQPFVPQEGPRTTKKPDRTRWPRQYGWDIFQWYN